MFPVGKIGSRVNVSPKSSSQSTGWTSRVAISQGSWWTFFSSIRQNVMMWSGSRPNSSHDLRYLPDTARGPPNRPDLANPPRFLVGVLGDLFPEDVLEVAPGPHLRDQGARCPDGPQPSV